MTPGRPVTFVMTQTFLDHFGLETTKDLPGLKDLRAAGLLESRVPPGIMSGSDIEDEDDDSAQSDMFEDE
jgi:segregation and condensation protein B